MSSNYLTHVEHRPSQVVNMVIKMFRTLITTEVHHF